MISVSAILTCLTIYAAHRAHLALRSRRGWQRLFLHLAVAGATFFVFIWLSPQIYYLFYMACLPDLPAQIVVGRPPSATELAQLLWIDLTADLPPIAQGLLGWILLAQAVSQALVDSAR